MPTPDATKAYADACWRADPTIASTSWRVWEGLMLGKFFAPPSQQFDESLAARGINVWWHSHHQLEAAQNFAAAAQKSEHLTVDNAVVLGGVGYTTNKAAGAAQVVPGVWHHLAPTTISTQVEELAAALAPFPLTGISLLEPEYALANLISNNVQNAKEQFYAQLTTTFTALEKLCAAGSLPCYGISSNMLGLPADDPLHIDLAQVITAAQTAATAAWGRRKRPHFRFISTPLNVLELGLLHTTNTQAKTFADPVPTTTLELAARAHLGVFAQRPLTTRAPNRPPLDLTATGNSPAWQALNTALAQRLPAAWQKAPLPAIALNLIASLPGVIGTAWQAPPAAQQNLTLIQQRGDFSDPAALLLSSAAA